MHFTPPLKPQPDWDLYRALREQWRHEDNLVNHRLMWLILSEGLLFTAYGTLYTAKLHWLVFGFPFFGMAVVAVIGAGIFAALGATDEISQRIGNRGKLAAQSLPFVFGALWLLAMAGAFGS